MKKEFLKMAGVENEKDFYKLFPTEQAFFGMYPEAKKLVQKKYSGLIKADAGFNVTSQTSFPANRQPGDNVATNAANRPDVQGPTAEQLAALNPNIARNPMFRTFSGNVKLDWGNPKTRNVFSYGLTKEAENPFYTHRGGLSFNNLFAPGRGNLSLTGTYTPKTGEYNTGFQFGMPSKRMMGKGENAQPRSNFTAGYNMMRNDEGERTNTGSLKYNTRLGNPKTGVGLSAGVEFTHKYGGLVKASGGFNVTGLSTKPSMNCSNGICQMNTEDYSWQKENRKIKPPKPITPWEAITWNKGEIAQEDHDKLKEDWKQNKNLYTERYPNLTYDEFYAANQLEKYNRLNQGQYNNYFDAQGNPTQGMDERVYSAQPYIPWTRAAFNTPTPSREAILDYFQTHKLKKDDVKNFVNERYTFPKEHMVAPPYFRMGGGLSQFAPGGFTTVSTTTSSINAVLADMQRWKEEQASRYPGSTGAASSSTYVANRAVVDPALAQGVKVKQGETREQATARTNREIAEKKKKEAARRAAATRAHENKQVQETQARVNQSNESSLNGFGILNPNNWTRENWAKTAIGDKMRFFPNDGGGWGRAFDDYLNPLRAIGSVADDMASAPLLAKQTNSNMPYVTSFGIPLVGGMVMGKSGFKFPGSKAASNPSLTGVTRSGMFNPRDFKQMVRNPKQYFTKPGEPHVPIGIDYDEIARMNSGTIGPFDQTARIYQWGPRPPRVIDWGKVGRTGAGLGYLSGAAATGAYLGNKPNFLPSINQWFGNKDADKKKGGGELKEFNPGGFVTTNDTTKYPPLQSDVDILNEGRQELLDWYTARANHSDPRISGEARQVLENFSKLPADVSQGVDYKGINYLVSTGVLGRYEPYRNRVELSNPYLSVEEQLNKPGFGYIRKDPKLKEHYEKVYTLSRTGEPIKHEGKHRDLEETADPIVNKYSDQIYSQFVSPEEYREHLYERLGKPDLSRKAAGKWGEANFDRDAYYGYRWITGTGFPNFKVNRKGHVKNMINAELNRALMELRTEYKIDPTKNTTPDDFKNIYEKAKKSYEDAIQNKDPEKRLRYEHFLDLFNIHGNDFEKMNNLNNLIVGEVSSNLPVADEGFNVTTDLTSKSPQQIAAEWSYGLLQDYKAGNQDLNRRLNNDYRFSLSNQNLATLPSSEDIAAARRLEENEQFLEENPNAGTMARGDNTVLVKNFPVRDPITGRLIQPQERVAPAWTRPLTYEAWNLANQPGIATRLQRNPPPLWAQLIDPTGVTNYGNVKTSYEDMINSEGFFPTLGNSLLFGLDVLSSVPVFGKGPKIITTAAKGSRAAKGAKKVSKVVKPSITKEILFRPITNIDRFTGANSLFRLSSSAPKWLNKTTDVTNTMNRGGRYMKGLFGGIDYGLDALSNLGSGANESPSVASNPVKQEYSTSNKKVEDDSSYVDPSRGDQIVSVKLPDGTIAKMSTGSKAYADFLERVDMNDATYDEKTGMFIIKKYKK